MKVHVRHLRQAHHCARGARRWFARHDLDWRGFVRNGIEAEALIATGDPMAMKVVDAAREEHDGR
ncbi:MAG: hypothetical protein WD750_05730 [Gammaproteobacteria bacterium]